MMRDVLSLEAIAMTLKQVAVGTNPEGSAAVLEDGSNKTDESPGETKRRLPGQCSRKDRRIHARECGHINVSAWRTKGVLYRRSPNYKNYSREIFIARSQRQAHCDWSNEADSPRIKCSDPTFG
jgi:hypothetical protein